MPAISTSTQKATRRNFAGFKSGTLHRSRSLSILRVRRSQMEPLEGAGLPPPEPDEDSFRNALVRNEGPRGEVEKGMFSSFFSSSLSFGEYAAPNGLCMSSFDAGGLAFGAVCGFMFDCDGGVEPDENLELRLEIHEPRLPIGFGAVFGNCGSVGVVVPLVVVESPFLVSFSDRESAAWTLNLTGAGGAEAFLGSRGLLSGGGTLSELERCSVGVSPSWPGGFSQFKDETDRQRERLLSAES